MVSDLNKFYKLRAEDVSKKLMTTRHYNDIGIKNINKWASNVNDKLQVKLQQLVLDFLVHEDIGRNEYIKLYRGNRGLFKNTQELTKRQRLVSTPIQQLYEKNTASKKDERNKVDWMDEPYGANPTFTSMAFDDLKGDITNTIQKDIDSWVDRTISILKVLLLMQVKKILITFLDLKVEHLKKQMV